VCLNPHISLDMPRIPMIFARVCSPDSPLSTGANFVEYNRVLQELDTLFQALDSDRSGEIDVGEFIDRVRVRKKMRFFYVFLWFFGAFLIIFVFFYGFYREKKTFLYTCSKKKKKKSNYAKSDPISPLFRPKIPQNAIFRLILP
jgi:hypothetical protein